MHETIRVLNFAELQKLILIRSKLIFYSKKIRIMLFLKNASKLQACLSFCIVYIDIVISLSLLGKYVKELDDEGILDILTEYYPTFFNCLNGLLACNALILLLLIAAGCLIFKPERKNLRSLVFFCLIVCITRLIISIIFFIDPNEDYVKIMKDYNSTEENNIHKYWKGAYYHEIAATTICSIMNPMGCWALWQLSNHEESQEKEDNIQPRAPNKLIN